MTVKIDGTNTVANPAFTGADTDTGLQCGTNELKLVTGGNTRATIDSSGSLGVGTESPGNRLHVASGSSTGVRYQATSSGSVYTRFENTDNARGYIGYEAKKLVFYGDNGTNSANKKFAAMDADGLKFNEDTASANALSDYEEGSWTPTAENFDGTLNVESADYVKVGRLVHINMYVSFSNTQDTSNILIGGLPFTAAEQNNHYSLISAHSNGNIPDLALRSQGTSTYLTAVYLANSDGDTKPNYNHVRGQFIIAGGTYYTT